MDLAALRDRVVGRASTAFRTRRDQAVDLVDRVPILGRLVSEFLRIEFIDRCMLIAAQGLLALIPMLVVLAAFFPDLTSAGIHQFSSAAGMGDGGNAQISGSVDIGQVRAQTGLVGLVITFFSATSFGRAVQRMYERIWEQPHIGGIAGTRRCFVWLVGWLLMLQLLAVVVRVMNPDGLVLEGFRLAVQMALTSAVWLVSVRLLLFGRVPWRMLLVGAVLTGVVATLYSRGSQLVMPAYVDANAAQFGTLGVILSVSTWLIGFAAVLVGAALVGRVVSEDPTVRRVVSSTAAVVQASRRRWRAPEDGPAAPPPAG